MSKKLSRSDALADISTWSTNDVLSLLRKNGLEECCGAIEKRQIDGDELLHLTERKLTLWKSDLTRPLIWSLWSFVEGINRSPEKYVEEHILGSHVNEDHLSDTGSWGTDFEDETNDENMGFSQPEKSTESNPGFGSKQIMSQENKNKNTEMRTSEIMPKEEDGETYANYVPMPEDRTTYMNFQEPQSVPLTNVSKLHTNVEKSLAEQLKEELKLRNASKPTIGPKPKTMPIRNIGPKPETMPIRNVGGKQPEKVQPQKSFLHNASKPKAGISNQTQKRMSVPPPPEPKKQNEVPLIKLEKNNKNAAKPPPTIRNLDLVANLPTGTEESEDEYEAFDEQIIEQNQKENVSRVSSKQSLASGHQSSVESVYRPSSITSQEDKEEQFEIYESITEAPDANEYYLRPIHRTPNSEPPPPLPAKPLHSSPNLNRSKPDRSPKRSPEKKSATLPHASSSSSLSTERATRPLPPPPDRQPFTDKPWFHNLTRKEATNLIKGKSTYGNPQDGYFLLRPSSTNKNNPLALVLWFKDRVYNVPVRKRPDNRYALGSAKVNEQSFSSVEEIVSFYTKEELVLYTGGSQTGSTKLTDSPPK